MSEFKANPIHPELVKAYLNARYSIEVFGRNIQLAIDKTNPLLTSIMNDYEVVTAAFITAFNPHSRIIDFEENKIMQMQLEKDVSTLGYRFLKGFGEDFSGKWPKEESILILGITINRAEFLANQYRQNGYLWISSQDGVCNLRLCNIH
jgi:hypothetical protein